LFRFLNSKIRVHSAPWLTIKNDEILARFLHRSGIGPGLDSNRLINMVAEAFKLVPYENLTKILKASSVISAASAMRYPDEVIGDYLAWGTGGTCFSLTASIVAVYDALGIEVYPVLADRRYGVDTHCGLVLVVPGGKLFCWTPVTFYAHRSRSRPSALFLSMPDITAWNCILSMAARAWNSIPR